MRGIKGTFWEVLELLGTQTGKPSNGIRWKEFWVILGGGSSELGFDAMSIAVYVER